MLLLATDAVPPGCLNGMKRGGHYGNALPELSTPESFAAMVAYGRKNGLRNDDLPLSALFITIHRLKRRRDSDGAWPDLTEYHERFSNRKRLLPTQD